MVKNSHSFRLKYPLFLLLVCGISYGLLIPWLGFYWDDFPMGWIPYQLGPAGTARYFSTNRPVWGWLYQVTTPVLGMTPWAWQIFAIIFRWASGITLWRVLKRIWPGKIWIAETASIFVVLFPAFRQQYIALLYSHFFIVLTAFFLSFDCMLSAIQNPGKKNLYTGAGLFLSAANLFMLEYFFTLEIIRPIVIYWMVHKDNPKIVYIVRKVIKIWLPYLGVFLLAGLWRFYLYPAQTKFYQFNMLEQIQDHPAAGLLEIWERIVNSFRLIFVEAWYPVFDWVGLFTSGKRILVIYSLIVLFVGGWVGFYFFKHKSMRSAFGHPQARTGAGLTVMGLITSLAAGWPIWLVGRGGLLEFPEDRLSLPFMMGFALFFTGLIEILTRTAWQRIGLITILTALMVGNQYRLAEEYVLDWEIQKNFFWQLNWRIPDLQPGTTLLSNKLPVKFYSDNSLAAPLNWLYAPENHTDRLDFMLYYPESRQGGGKLPSVEPGLDIYHDYLGAVFQGNTSDSVAIFFSLRSCVRVLEAYPESNNPLLPEILKEASILSSVDRILVDGDRRLPQPLYRPEPEHGWCYFFEIADLARQQGDWRRVISTGADAISLGLSPKDGSECYPFIQANLAIKEFDQALQWTLRGVGLNPDLSPYYCQVWRNHLQGLEADTAQLVWTLVSEPLQCED